MLLYSLLHQIAEVRSSILAAQAGSKDRPIMIWFPYQELLKQTKKPSQEKLNFKAVANLHLSEKQKLRVHLLAGIGLAFMIAPKDQPA